MAFTSAIVGNAVMGNKKFKWGTYASSGGGVGGDINTGLTLCEGFWLQPTGAAVGTNQSKMNETLPITGSAITIVTDADQVGNWYAFGT